MTKITKSKSYSQIYIYSHTISQTCIYTYIHTHVYTRRKKKKIPSSKVRRRLQMGKILQACNVLVSESMTADGKPRLRMSSPKLGNGSTDYFLYLILPPCEAHRTRQMTNHLRQHGMHRIGRPVKDAAQT